MAKANIKIPFIAINLYHSTFLRNVEPDLDEHSGGSADLDQKIARIGGFPHPYSPLSLRTVRVRIQFISFQNSLICMIGNGFEKKKKKFEIKVASLETFKPKKRLNYHI